MEVERSVDKHVDVVVIGGGGSGLAAAIEAASHGGNVVLLEKNAALGGTTAQAIGSVSASSTDEQRRKGIVDSVFDHFEDMGLFAGEYADRDNLALRRVFVENSGPTLAWLKRQGLVFLGPMEEPPHRRARMYNVLPGSKAYVQRLGRVARRRGVEIRTRTRALRPIERDGRVTGVECAGPDGRYDLHARRAVILAAGDFSGNAELKKRYLGPLEARVDAVNGTSTGDGIAIGLEAGGHVVNGDLALGPEIRFVPPKQKLLVQRISTNRLLASMMKAAVAIMPDAVMRRVIMAFATTYLAPTTGIYGLGAMLVNQRGDRFVDERDRPWDALADQPDGIGWIIVDSRVAATLNTQPHYVSTAPGIAYAYLDDYRNSRKDIFHEAPSLEQLARSIGVPAEKLTASIAAANGERPQDQTCQAPPFVALGPVRSWIVLTEGGLAVDENCRVLDDDARPIAGLYAAGSNGQGGLLLEGHGNHLGWAFVSGRVAGRHAMTAQDQR